MPGCSLYIGAPEHAPSWICRPLGSLNTLKSDDDIDTENIFDDGSREKNSELAKELYRLERQSPILERTIPPWKSCTYYETCEVGVNGHTDHPDSTHDCCDHQQSMKAMISADELHQLMLTQQVMSTLQKSSKLLQEDVEKLLPESDLAYINMKLSEVPAHLWFTLVYA